MDRERGIQSDLVGILAKQSRADAVEGAGPVQGAGHNTGIGAEYLARDALDAPRHLGRRAPRERHQKDPVGVCAPGDQVRDTMGEGVRLAGSGTGE